MKRVWIAVGLVAVILAEAASVERAAFFWLALIAICLGCIVNSSVLRSFGLAFILVMNRGSVL